MSLDIGSLVGYIKLDHSGVGKGIQAAQADMRAATPRLAATAGQAGEKAGKEAGGKLAGAFKNQVGQLTGIVAGAFATAKIVQALGATRDAAAGLNETTNMAGVIYGKNAKAMEAWAGNAPRTLGLATEAALRMGASFADMFLQIGFAQNKATDMSKTVLQMAADLGSFKNLDTGDVLDRIAAGFRGEYDSLQLLIPNISAARVQQEALAATGRKSADSLTAQEKAAATLAIIQKDGARAMGDFANTADDYANASKIAAAETENLKAKIGQQLLPAYLAMVLYGRDHVLPFLSQTVDGLGQVANAAKPAADVVGDLVHVFQQLPGPVQASTIALIAMVAMRSRVEALGNGIQSSLGKGASNASSALDSLRIHMMYAGDAAEGSGSRFGHAAKAIGTSASAGLRGAASGLLGLLGGPWGVAFTAAIGAVSYFIKQHQDAKARVEDFTRAVEADSGALGKNTRESVANALEKAGAAKAARELGIDLKDLTDAALGQADAQERVNDRLKQVRSVSEEAASSGGDLSAQYGELWAAANKVQGALTGTNGELKDARDAAKRHAEMVGEDADANNTAADSADKLAGATGEAGKKLDEVKDAAKKAAQAVLDLHEAQLEASGAEISYQDALGSVQERLEKRKELLAELAKAGGVSDRTKNLEGRVGEEKDPKKRAKLEKDLSESRSKDARKQTEDQKRIRDELAEYALTLDITTKAGRENQKALNDQADAANAQAEKNIKAGDSLKAVRTQMATSRAEFIKNAETFGASKTVAENMANQYGLTQGAVDNLAKSLDGLPASKQIQIEVDTKTAQAKYAALLKQLSGGHVSIVVDQVTGTRLVNSGKLANGGRGQAGGLTINEADGGVVKYYADGAHVAQHVPAGSWRVFGEPETGGETYIPHAPGKRARSTRILAETADMFGYALTPKSVNTSHRITILHRGNVVAPDPAGYAEDMRQMARHDALTEM